jgi:DNA-binding MarR family transcriptional regulator
MVEYEDCIVFNLAKAYQTAHGRLAALLKPLGITPIQTLVLDAIAGEDGPSASEIGKRLLLDNATISGVLDRLADGGWIVKQADERDRRALRIFPSDKALDLNNQVIEARDEANDQILAELTLEEKVLLKRLLRDIR